MNNTPPPNLLRDLRQLVPQRRLRYGEAKLIAELQANLLRERLGITEPEFTEAVIEGIPRLTIRRHYGLPVSGLTHWHNGRWMIVLNADEPDERQHFSLAHELKHVLDHTTVQWTCPDEPGHTTAAKAEHLADYFAATLLMPNRHVKALFGQHHGDLPSLAAMFGVSRRAMQVRLSQLGMIEPTPRCLRPPARWEHFGSAYYRARSPITERASA